MKSALAHPISSLIVAQGSSWLFEFTTEDAYIAHKIDVRVGFPQGFSTNNAGCEIIGLSAKTESEVLYD